MTDENIDPVEGADEATEARVEGVVTGDADDAMVVEAAVMEPAAADADAEPDAAAAAEPEPAATRSPPLTPTPRTPNPPPTRARSSRPSFGCSWATGTSSTRTPATRSA